MRDGESRSVLAAWMGRRLRRHTAWRVLGQFLLYEKGGIRGGLARQITRVLRAALAELEATEFAAKEMPTQQRVKPVAKAGIKAVLLDSVLAVVRADYAAGMGLADIANKHALYAKHGMYFTDGEPACG